MRQSQPRSKSPVTKFLSLALALCMIAAFIPAFTLTASAAGAITIGDTTLIYDTTALAADLDAFTFEFDLTTATNYTAGYKDVGVKDTAGNYITAFAYSWRSGDGIWPFEGERSGLSSIAANRVSYTEYLDELGNATYGTVSYALHEGTAHITIQVLNDTANKQYTVTYYVGEGDDIEPISTATYSGNVEGIALPTAWDYTSGGSSANWSGDNVYFANSVVASNSGNVFTNFTVSDSDNGTILYSSEKTVDTSAYAWYAFEFEPVGTGSYKDLGLKDANGHVFMGICQNWSVDGIWVADGERTIDLYEDWTDPLKTETNSTPRYGNATSSNGSIIRAVVEDDSENQQYTVTWYYVNNDTPTAFATAVYDYETAAPIGITVPAGWDYTGGGSGIDSATAAYAFSNFKVYAGEYSANSNTVTINYKDGDIVVSTSTVTYDPDIYTTGYTFAAQYIYYNDSEVYYLPEATITADTDISVSPYRYLSDDFKDKSTFTYDNVEYVPADGADTFTSVIVNGDFVLGDTTAWTNRMGTAITGASFSTEDGIDGNIMTLSAGGAGYTNAIGTVWTVETGTTYYMSFYVGGGKPDESKDNGQYNRVSDAYTVSGSQKSISGNILSSYGYDMVDGEWTLFETVFEAATDVVYFQSSWTDYMKIAAFQLIPIEPNTEKLANVTVYYTLDGTADTVIEDLTQTTTVTKGNSVSFDAVSAYLYDGAYYKYDAITYDDVQADITEYVTLDIDTSVFAPTAAISWNFTMGTTAYATSFSGSGYAFSESAKDGLMTVSWNNVRHSLLKFNVETESDKALTGATLHVTLGRSNSWSTGYFTVYAVNPALIDGDNETIDVATGSTLAEAISALGGYVVVGSTNTAGSNPTTFDLVIDLSDYLTTFPDAGSEVAFMIVSTSGQMGFYRTGEYAPYLSDITTVDTVTYSVDYVDTLGIALDTSLTEDAASGSYTTTEANTLGYNNEVVCDYVPIPYFTGYVFKSKTVDASEKKITLIYEETDDTAYFFDTADSDATLISLNMLGAHDAFTANIDDVKYDAAGIATDDSGSKSFIAACELNLLGSKATAIAESKAQSADALTLLNSGVRYFDIRVSHSTVDTTYGLYTAPHTNGVFYTTHGGLSDEFRPIAYTIAQWAKQHPGEIIVLNFQSAFEDGGTATTTTWSAINAILEESGINDYVSIKNSNAGSGNLAGATISSYTDDREHAGILVFGQSTGANNNIGNFILNKYGDEFSGRLYSNYQTDLDSNISTSFSPNYIQAQVDYADTFGSGNDNHIITWMMRVMQAQSESTDLIGQADDDNTALYNALASGDHTDWLTALPIVMVNDAVTNTTDLVALLKAHNNAREITVNYVNGESTVATKTKSLMTGTLYTDETTRGIINGTDAKYYVTAAPTTVYNNGIILVPSTGDINVDVTATGDIYTYASADGTDRTAGTILSGNLATTTDTGISYDALTSFGACNWGADGTYDRIGIAVLDLPDKTEAGVAEKYTDAVSYVLKATRVRDDVTDTMTTKFYAISYDTYLTTDFSVASNVTDILASAEPVAKYTRSAGGSNSDLRTEEEVEFTLTLDDEYTDKIVIIGCSTAGLYVLTDMYIEPEINYGIELVDGAQIRVGGGVTDANELNGEESGLRFIAVLTTANTLASYVVDETVNATAGIAIWDGGVTTETVDASAIAKADLDNPVANYDATKYQAGTDTIFSVAITNINSANYNRIYVAVPYIKIGDTYYYNYDEAVARTPYQVAAGILTDNSDTLKDSQGNTYVYSSDVDSLLIKVLNVYANKTGARITLDSSYNAAVAEYSNGAAAFFDVDCTDNGDGTYTITFTVKDGGAVFYSYAADTYRVNKSHTDFETYFGVEEGDVTISEDGTQMIIIITDPDASSAGTETE